MTTANQVCILPKDLKTSLSFHYSLPGTQQQTLLVLGNDQRLYEVQCFLEPCRSWITSDSILQDGRLFFLTPMDMLFLIIPILEAQDEKEYLDVSDQLVKNGYSYLAQALGKDPTQLECICASQTTETDKLLYKLSPQKVMTWLKIKMETLVEKLQTVESKDNMESYALDLMSPYLTAKCKGYLAEHFKINIDRDSHKEKSEIRVNIKREMEDSSIAIQPTKKVRRKGKFAQQKAKRKCSKRS